MTTTSPRPFIAAMQVTLDGYIIAPEGEADAPGIELGERVLVICRVGSVDLGDAMSIQERREPPPQRTFQW